MNHSETQKIESINVNPIKKKYSIEALEELIKMYEIELLDIKLFMKTKFSYP